MIGVVLIIVYLRGFQPHIIHAYFCCKFFYIFYLVFIRLYNQELKNNKWRFTF